MPSGGSPDRCKGSGLGSDSFAGVGSWGYQRKSVESKWQDRWQSDDAFAAPPPDGRPASYVYAGYARAMRDDDLDCVRRFVVADAYARFRRDQGDAMLFALGIESFCEVVELESNRRNVSPSDVIDSYQSQVRQRFERLGISCDWARTVVTSRPEHCRRTQLVFLALLERDLVYRRDMSADAERKRSSQWLLRSSAYAESCERCLDALPGWTSETIQAQREALGRVDGIEVDAVLLGGGELPAFTPHPDAISDAAFIAMSPLHPEVEAVASLSLLEDLQNDPSAVKMVQTKVQAAIPGVDALLPIVVAPSVDTRFGPTASLGIPSRDETDREIADRLETLTRLPFRTSNTGSKPRPAARYRLPDQAISRMSAWGIPIPMVHCNSCAFVPVSAEELPVLLPATQKVKQMDNAPTESQELHSCKCPKCGGPARRDYEMIDSHFDSMWMWLSICIPPADRKSSTLSHPECDRWLPARQIVWNADAPEQLLYQRMAGRAMSDLDLVPSLDAGEPFTEALVNGSVDDGGNCNEDDCIGSVEELDELLAGVGADIVRLAILHAASPRRSTSWSAHSIRHSQRFLRELWDYAEPRLRARNQPIPLEIDGSTRLRRRLSVWCRVAADKIVANFERLEMHRATYDTMLLLKRIQDFEDRCADDGKVAPLDRDAVVVALLKLVQLATPCIPHIAAELEAIASSKVPHSVTITDA